jgi:SAM-dependent methyltransferase
MATVSQMDKEFLPLGREHITRFLERTAARLSAESGRLLEIGPQDRLEVRNRFRNYSVDTFDIVATCRPTYVGDITKHNAFLADGTYDCVVCMEVLEHTLDPFGAVREMRRLLKNRGYLLLSAPLNARIHGPIPDCWRFTEHGFKVLLRDFDILELDILETPGRDLFPIHYNLLAQNDKHKQMADADLKFRFID